MKERRQSSTAAGQEESVLPGSIGRRSFVRTAAAGGAATAAALAATGLGAVPAIAATKDRAASAGSTSAPTLVDAGAGMHSGIGTVQMMGIATISNSLVTCAVGQMGLTFSQLSVLTPFLEPILGLGILGPGWSGPFAMEMYSYNVTSYNVDRGSGVIKAKGVVRSITKIAGVVIEDANSPYVCVATDNDGRSTQPDSYYLSYSTPFWSRPGNPLATPSTFHSGWSMFGGEIIVGDISVPE